MRKVFILVSILLIGLFGMAQYPVNQNLGSDSTLVTSKGGFKGRLINTIFVDTTAANLQRISQYPGSQIYTTFDNSFWLRNSTATTWLKIAKQSDIVSIVGCNSLLTGGVVTYSGSGLIFDVSPANYFINCGGIYNSPQTQITLAAADPSLPRVDVVAVNTSGAVVVLTGTPAADPVKPQINATSQLELTHIDIAAGATTPGGVTTVIIYDENTEWATSSTNVTANFDNTNNPFHATKAVLATSVINGSTFKFDYGSTDVNVSNYSALKIYIRTESSSADYGTFYVKFGYNGTILGGVTVISGTYGFSSGLDGVYQVLTIPISDFPLSSNIANELYIQMGSVGFTSCYLDYIQLQGGIPSGNSPYITNIFRKPGTDSVFAVINNVPVFQFKDSTGGAGSVDSLIYSTRLRLQQKIDSLGGVIAGIKTIYNSDGTFNDDRIIDGDLHTLSLTNFGEIFITASPRIDLTVNNGSVWNNLILNNGESILEASSNTPYDESIIQVTKDSIILQPHYGNLEIDSLNAFHNLTDSMLVWNKTNGYVGYRAIPSGSGSYTFSNGLTEAAGAVKLGGTLTGATTIDGANKSFQITGLAETEIGSTDAINIHADLGVEIGSTNSKIDVYSDSVILDNNNGIYKIKNIPYTLSTTGKKIMLRDTATGLVQNIDPALLGFGATNTLAVFGAGAGLSTDTAAFQTTSIYGSFYNDGTDTLIITKAIGVLQGSSPSITPTIYFNDSLNVTAGATKLVNSPSALTNTTTGTAVTSFDNYKIPPGVWVWVSTGTVGTKPTYFSLSLIGYKKPVI